MTHETVLAILATADERYEIFKKEFHYRSDKAVLKELIGEKPATKLIRAVAAWRIAGKPGLDTKGDSTKAPAGRSERSTVPYTTDSGSSNGVAVDQTSRAPGFSLNQDGNGNG